jgi:hypothetical protein
MAKNNIYDLIIAELILRAPNDDNLNTTQLKITNSLDSVYVPVNFSAPVAFTSTVLNPPLGYSVVELSHEISYPNATTTQGSALVVTGANVSVVLSTLNSTYTVNSTVTLRHNTNPADNADIVLTASQIITAISPLFYGVKPFALPPNTNDLATTHVAATTFTMTFSSLGRLYIVTPTAHPMLLSVKDFNGLTLPITSNFTVVENAGLRYYILTYDIILVGSNQKVFTLNYI